MFCFSKGSSSRSCMQTVNSLLKLLLIVIPLQFADSALLTTLNIVTISPWFHALGCIPASKNVLNSFLTQAKILSLAHLIISEMMLSRACDLFAFNDFTIYLTSLIVNRLFKRFSKVNNCHQIRLLQVFVVLHRITYQWQHCVLVKKV